MALILPDRRFGGYIFDCDGTLADTMPLHYRGWLRLIEEHGGVFPEDLFYSLGGMPTRKILEKLRLEQGLDIVDLESATHRKEAYFLEYLHEVKAIDAVVDVARGAHGVIPMAVASGGFRRYVEMTLDIIGIRHLFDVVICAEDYARPKPAPDPFLLAAERLGVGPADCLVFEDAELGVQAAQAAGMDCVFVPRALR